MSQIKQRNRAMKMIVPLVAALVVCSTASFAGGDSFSEPTPQGGPEAYPGPGGGSLYDRISAHYRPYGRDVEEEFRDGPCKVERRWERDGDFEEHIACKGPRD
jgi:hypothetical protein